MHRNLGIGSWIARRARTSPDHIAILFGQHGISYRELDRRVMRVARAFQSHGVVRGERVAFVGDNHPAALETLFACGVLGAIAVPMHPGFNEPTLVHVLGSTEPTVVVTTTRLESRVKRACAQLGIDAVLTAGATSTLDDSLPALSSETLDEDIRPDDPCVIAFSSGTTGRNKGVQLTHGNLLWNAINILTALDFLHSDRLLTSAPLYRMGGLGFCLTMLLKGGTCVLQERADPLESLRLVDEHRVSVVFDSVGALEAWTRERTFATADLSSLRICLTGGSMVPPSLVRSFGQRGLSLQPGYGLTEAAPIALLSARSDADELPGAAGRPPLFCATRIVDQGQREVSPGQVGELLVSGPNVMEGYWRDPDATRRAMSDGWLRTGDAAWADESGMVTIVGRVSDALVLRGSLFHPGPSEQAIREIAGVRDCAIVQEADDETAIVCVELEPSTDIAPPTLIPHCRRLLGDVDLAVNIVSELPRNPNGKIVRPALLSRHQSAA